MLPTYADAGAENVRTYSFSAKTSGELMGYFAGYDAAYLSTLNAIVGGKTFSGLFPNHTTAVGTSFDFGHVEAGERLLFSITDPAGTFSSDVSRNADGFNHVYATDFAGGGLLPGGTYVGFEDQLGGGDADYNDLNFVFNETMADGTTTGLVDGAGPVSRLGVAPVPLPASSSLLGAALMLVGAFGLRRRRITAPTG